MRLPHGAGRQGGDGYAAGVMVVNGERGEKRGRKDELQKHIIAQGRRGAENC